MANSAIILLESFSTRLGQDKALLKLGDKTLILHGLERILSVVDEMIIVATTKEQMDKLRRIVKTNAEIVLNEHKAQTQLTSALTGFDHTENEYALLMSSDMPFINSDVARLLLECCINRTAAVPRWPDCRVEPMQAAYQTKSALTAAETALDKGKFDAGDIITNLRFVRYISTLVLEQLDTKLLTFFRVNTQLDLRRAETLIKTIKL